MSGDYSYAHELSKAIIDLLKEESIGYAQMACALTLCRLENPEALLPPEEEAAFVGALLEWADAYFVETGEAN